MSNETLTINGSRQLCIAILQPDIAVPLALGRTENPNCDPSLLDHASGTHPNRLGMVTLAISYTFAKQPIYNVGCRGVGGSGLR